VADNEDEVGLADGLKPYAVGVWLAAHPRALVAAVGGEGQPVPMPDSVPLLESHQVDERSFLSLVAPEDVTEVVNAFRRCLDNGISAARLKVAGGQWVSLHYVDVREQYGVVLRIVLPADGHDEEPGRPAPQLPASRPRLATLEKDELATIVSVDEATTSLLGWSAEEMAGRPSLEFIHPDDHPRAIDNWMQMIANGARHAVRLRYRTKDGSWIWLETSNEMRVDQDQRHSVHCQLIDISEEMAATEALHYSEALLRRITETVPVGLAEIGTDGLLRYVNPSLRALLRDHGASTVKEIGELLDPEDSVKLGNALESALHQGGDTDVDILLPGAGPVPDRSCRVAVKALTDSGQILGALVCVMDVTDLKAEAATDPLTALPNRTAIFNSIRVALSRPAPVGVIYLDINSFKSVNDSGGHAAGDRVLVEVADALREAVRQGDSVGRVGGDEFVAVCPHISSPDALLEVSQRLQAAAAAAIERSGYSSNSAVAGASVGVAWAEPGQQSAEELVRRADAAMYVGKRRRSTSPVLWELTEIGLGSGLSGGEADVGALLAGPGPN